MPRDIRSYFNVSPKGPGNQKKDKPVQPSDEDDTKGNIKQNEKVAKKSKKRVISSDSEEEKKVSPSKVKNDKKKKIEKETKNQEAKTASPHDIFGSKPVKRVNSKSVSKVLLKKESEFHEDPDFEKTLSQLDTSEIESNYFSEKPSEDKKNFKRKNLEDSDEIVQVKKQKSYDEENSTLAKDKQVEKKNDDSKSKDKKSPDSETPPAKNGKMQFEKLKKQTKTTNITFEKHENKVTKKPVKEPVKDIWEESIEKKKERAALYSQYLNRGGARNPGSKPIPEGATNCLAGLSFVITGVLDSLERDEAEELIHKYGGRTVAALSKRTDYLVIGEEAGASKLKKAAVFGTKQISEDDLLELIKSRPAGKTSQVVHSRKETKARKRSVSPEKREKSPSPKKSQLSEKVVTPEKEKKSDVQAGPSKQQEPAVKPSTSSGAEQSNSSQSNSIHPTALVDKYRPQSINKIIGQQEDKSNAKKLYNWLRDWHKNQNGPVKPTKPSPFARNHDGAFFKACLLSGPPGIGKTTTAQVVCAELGLDLLEFNASDTRSKRLLQEEVSGILSNNTVTEYFTQQPKQKSGSKHVLLMDEVDGMAGNEDRGGLQELITLIKNSEVPIICICNDRNHPKMRTLSNYTYDLRFQKPKLLQIRAAMKSICFKENINITTEELDQLIQSTNQDIRQVINQLAMLANTSSNQKTENKTKEAKKDVRLGPWDVVRKVFTFTEHRHMNIHEKSDLFFHDYNISGLFVQENYLLVRPKDNLLKRLARAAESLALGDIIENTIRGQNAWSLLPVQACFSSVIPGSIMSGQITGQINFPSWLGRNSKRGKMDRLLQEITVHSRLTTGGSKEAMNLDYLKNLRDAILRPLGIDGYDGTRKAIEVMQAYHFIREDVESLTELSLWPGDRDPLQCIDSKVKSSFTKQLNKCSFVPYLINVAPKKSTQASQDEGFEEEESDNDSIDEEIDMLTDRMIKPKKPSAKTKAQPAEKTEAKPAKRGRKKTK